MVITSRDTLFIDTNIFIYALESHGRLGESSRNLLKRLKKVNPSVYTSVLTIEEILVGAFKEHLDDRIPEYLQFVSGEGLIKIMDIDQEIAVRAAAVRAEYGLKTPDALQLGTALHVCASQFITADKRIPKKIQGIKIHLVG